MNILVGSTVSNLMSNMVTEGQSILMPPRFDGKNYTEWNELMKLFIQSVDFKLWFVIKNGPKIPKKLVENVEVEKSEEEYDEEDMKNLELEAKAKYILYHAMKSDTFENFSRDRRTAKQMWDDLARENSPTSDQQHPSQTTVSNAGQFNSPDTFFLEETEESKEKYLDWCVPLHKHALQGNWPAAKLILGKDPRLKHAAIARGWSTLLHVAASANHVPFVDKLLAELDDFHIRLQDSKGNTALCFAAASGNVHIAHSLLKRVPRLLTKRGAGGLTPLHFAVRQRKCAMIKFLYNEMNHTNEKEENEFNDSEKKSLFFSSIITGNYHLALKMVQTWRELAYARDDDDDTALHILALNQNSLDPCCRWPEIEPVKINPSSNKRVIFQLVKYLWDIILKDHDITEAIRIIGTPYQLIFHAAECGNFGFLSELISAYPDLIWEVDYKNQSLIHTAVLHRHASIFNLVHEIGTRKDIIVLYDVKGSNTLLHLAAKLAPHDQLELVSGAAFQMCLELVWFEEVKKIMHPSLIKNINSDNRTAQELFTEEHKMLREKAEDWMKRTAEQCMLISTVIATAVFSAAINIPGGIDDQTKKPNYLDKTSFLVFAMSDAAAFISSATAILIFLSILISRYAEYDFHKSLPLKLIIGLITLFISITCMMVAFGSAFFITYNYYDSKVVPYLISALAGLPILAYIALQCSLWCDILYSAFYSRNLFKPSKRKRMIYSTPNVM
ncbi:Ankyrin repeat-containing protein, partial [Mucuna pruriens]